MALWGALQLRALLWKVPEKNRVVTSKHEGVVTAPSPCAGGSGESGGHRGRLQRAQCSIALVALGRFGYLLPHTAVGGAFTFVTGVQSAW